MKVRRRPARRVPASPHFPPAVTALAAAVTDRGIAREQIRIALANMPALFTAMANGTLGRAGSEDVDTVINKVARTRGGHSRWAARLYKEDRDAYVDELVHFGGAGFYVGLVFAACVLTNTCQTSAPYTGKGGAR